MAGGKRKQQQQNGFDGTTDNDGFDGVYSTQTYGGSTTHTSQNNNGHFNPGHSTTSGVELELLSNRSSHTRGDHPNDRFDHQTHSDVSSHGVLEQHQPHQQLMYNQPLLQGVGEIAEPQPLPHVADEGRHIQRRRLAKQRAAEDESDAAVYDTYQAPGRTRSLVRPERATAGGATHKGSAAAARHRRKQPGSAGARGRRCCANPWQTYCRAVTFWAPGRVLKCFGMPDAAVQMAWREKIGLVSLILMLMGVIAFITFGLQQVLCGLSGKQTRVKWSEVSSSTVVVNGRAYDIADFGHPKSSPWTGPAGANLMGAPANAGGKDLSFLFQNPNGACKRVLNYADSLTDSSGNIISVFPCVYYNNTKQINGNQIPNNQGCHNTAAGRRALQQLSSVPVQYSWEDVRAQSNLVVFNGAVLDLIRGQFLLSGVQVPDDLAEMLRGSARGKDISLQLPSGDRKRLGQCMVDLFRVGSIDGSSLGCIAANIVLYVSLVVILGGVFAKFVMAIYFGWFMGPRLGQVATTSTPEDRRARQAEIEAWADVNNHVGKEKLERKYTVMGANGGGSAVANYGADTQSRANNRRSRFFPTTSRYSHFMPGDEPGARDKPRLAASGSGGGGGGGGARAHSGMPRHSAFFSDHRASHYAAMSDTPMPDTPADTMPLANPVDVRALQLPPSRPPATASPFNFELAYTLLLVTCYSEGSHGIRTTLDSLCGTDYPASHKCLFIICDGLIRGAGEDLYTPDVCLSMMTDFVIPPDRVQPYSYVSIAQGAKRHNMAKLYAGFYAPNDASPEHARANRVPMVLVVKCGTPEEANEPKPGNRGKRDSQIILMSFLQRVMFDERMTELEYELFNAMWNVTGVTPDNFEIVLMVDADTKVYVDSVTCMVKAMVDDPSIMGQCGETKIANKTDSW
ncbi:Chitin synthase, class 3, partial [Kickxella alabastrina]